MGEGEIGAKTERSLVARERLDIAALLMTHITELIMRLGECGKLSQSNFKLRDSFVESARSGKYIRCSAMVCVASGNTLEVGASSRKNHAPRNAHAGKRASAISVPPKRASSSAACGQT